MIIDCFKKKGVCLFFIWAFLSAALLSPALADEIYFKSGTSRTAVVIREKDGFITFKTEMGVSTVSRDNIDFVEKATDEENQVLLRKWREQERAEIEARDARRAAERAFEQEQLSKGMIQFENKWMTPEEKERILELRRQAREDRLLFEQEQRKKGHVFFQHLWVTPEQAQELRQMEPQIYSLYDQITAWRQQINSLRMQMSSVETIEEADDFSKRIEEVNQRISEATERLGKLLQRADEIEAASERYVMPEKFREAMASEE
ncbi:MAG: hypothetical protein C4520_17850 [Candidatus Abyssobacteria bacterium SURF_5]|uniref:DUF5667 domain-containing protein n=1 Tax=Abyssobacteria bacterium (strain SURF_5) TaxID=2093360 RepID=A0A3A4NF65_ABYX5|nr:MAG: hypothetical protein C4520_17850 [Candidatus Abyssubacteria bacterium SURF_5]